MDAPYVRTGQVELPHGICFICLITLIICFHVSRVSRVLGLHTEITEITELRIALLSLHPDGMFTLIIFDLTQRRKETQSLFLSSFNVHRSSFNVHLRTSEPQNLRTIHLLSTLNSQRLTLNVNRSTLNVPRSPFFRNKKTPPTSRHVGGVIITQRW